MLLFQKRFHEGLRNGSITATFRRWDEPRVKPGGRYRCHPIGVVEVDGLSRVKVADLTDADARAAGFSHRAELIDYLRSGGDGSPLRPSTPLYRVDLHYGGDGDRVPIALDAALTDADVAALKKKLAGFDARSPSGLWTAKTIRLIEQNPRVAASKLAPKLKLETAPFKANVVRLKKLGLTQSFEIGYELSPRGRAFLERTRRTTRSTSKRNAPARAHGGRTRPERSSPSAPK
ncbi:MAG: hypothetical protein IRZ16_20595 [Myxococcaceae bacterium]|nr:hypothetical protein [Myxococcaceae bacterium]